MRAFIYRKISRHLSNKLQVHYASLWRQSVTGRFPGTCRTNYIYITPQSDNIQLQKDFQALVKKIPSTLRFTLTAISYRKISRHLSNKLHIYYASIWQHSVTERFPGTCQTNYIYITPQSDNIQLQEDFQALVKQITSTLRLNLTTFSYRKISRHLLNTSQIHCTSTWQLKEASILFHYP